MKAYWVYQNGKLKGALQVDHSTASELTRAGYKLVRVSGGS